MRLRTHGSVKTYFHEEVGYNSRLDALQAAVLSGQAAAPRRVERAGAGTTPRTTPRRFADCARRCGTPVVEPGQRVDLQPVHDPRCERRDELQAHLTAKGIGTSVYYPLPLHLQPCFAYLGYQAGQLPGVGAGGARGAVAAGLPRTHARAARRSRRRPCAGSSDAKERMMAEPVRRSAPARRDRATATASSALIGLGYVGLPLAMEFCASRASASSATTSAQRVVDAAQCAASRTSRTCRRRRRRALRAARASSTATTDEARLGGPTPSRSPCRRRW